MTTKPETLISVAATLVRGVPWRVPSERTRVPVWVRAQLVEIDEWARDLGCRVRDGYDALRKRAEKAEAELSNARLVEQALRSDRAVLVEVVKWYASGLTWHRVDNMDAGLARKDRGELARAALAKAGEPHG